jgi:glutamate formiminotransferase
VKPIVECVPNISEGRRPEVVEAIVNAVRETPGATLLDHGADADHNRAVLTFVGAPEPVLEAAFRVAERASKLIDLSGHDGVHPRIGAVDVIPFVPLLGTPMELCVELAEKLGARIGEQLSLPVFLYERAAREPSRRSLSDLRRGGLAGLAERMARNPRFKPDFGPASLHRTAGAVAIGARSFLIAYNIDLDTDDPRVADKIARSIRASSEHGLPGIKALGFRLEGQRRVQVSMNVTDYQRCSLGRVYRRVEELAREQGVGLKRSELVGLVPRGAVVRAAEELLGLELDESRVLEQRVSDEIAGPTRVHTFLEKLASTSPAPGGGAAAAMAGALAAGAAGKVVAIGEQNTKDQEARARLGELRKELHRQRWGLLELVEQDAKAYRGFAAALKRPKGTDEEKRARKKAIGLAAITASEAPIAIATALLHTLRATEAATVHVKGPLIADVIGAAGLGMGALEAAKAMLRANLPYVKDKDVRAHLEAGFDAAEAEATAIATRLRELANS